MSLVSLSLGFSVFGILIIVNRHRADLNGHSGDSFVAAVGGVGGLIIGICFLVGACLHWSILFGPSAWQLHSPGASDNRLIASPMPKDFCSDRTDVQQSWRVRNLSAKKQA